MKARRVERIEVDDATTLEVVIVGSGQAIVLLPALALGADSYEDLSEALSDKGFKSIAINLRGTAGSTGDLADINLHDLAADVAAVISKLVGEPVPIVGNAFGNRVARCLAADHPELVSGLILLAAGGAHEIDGDVLQAMFTMLTPDASDQQKREAAQFALVSPGFDPAPILNLQWWPDVAGPYAMASQQTPVDEWWGGGQADILILQGALDKIAPAKYAHEFAAEYGSRVSVVEYSDTGHAVLEEKPQEVARAIQDFVKQSQP